MQRITKKRIMNKFKNIISIPYCELAYLFPNHERDFYTSGIYGWNADVYILDGQTCLVTGYRPFGNFEPGKSLCAFFDNVAKHTPENRLNLQKEFARRVLKECVRKN